MENQEKPLYGRHDDHHSVPRHHQTKRLQQKSINKAGSAIYWQELPRRSMQRLLIKDNKQASHTVYTTQPKKIRPPSKMRALSAAVVLTTLIVGIHAGSFNTFTDDKCTEGKQSVSFTDKIKGGKLEDDVNSIMGQPSKDNCLGKSFYNYYIIILVKYKSS